MNAKVGWLLAALMVAGSFVTDTADAGHYGRWQRRGTYHYTHYYYTPVRYHVVVCYPSRPRYFYYYNPYRRTYWGRFDTEGAPGQQYSILAPEDRRENLADIPESAFPPPGPMPVIPESDGDERIELPPAFPA
ncbi:MAG: hypothetical protein EA381_14520, partial [Planctomycetaceae bacterium]